METEIGREIGEKAVVTLTLCLGLCPHRGLSLLLFLTYGNVGFVAKQGGRTDILNFAHLFEPEKAIMKSCAHTAEWPQPRSVGGGRAPHALLQELPYTVSPQPNDHNITTAEVV